MLLPEGASSMVDKGTQARHTETVVYELCAVAQRHKRDGGEGKGPTLSWTTGPEDIVGDQPYPQSVTTEGKQDEDCDGDDNKQSS